jgi:hypothetical protein
MRLDGQDVDLGRRTVRKSACTRCQIDNTGTADAIHSCGGEQLRHGARWV